MNAEINAGMYVFAAGLDGEGVVIVKTWGGWCLVKWDEPSAKRRKIWHVDDLRAL